MTDDEMVRLTAALVGKWERFPLAEPGYLSHASLEGIIGTTVADVLLVAEGTLTIEDYEQATA